MNKKNLAVLAVTLFAGAGCLRTDYPRATLASAYDAIQKDDLDQFKQTITPELAKTLGNAKAMKKLQAEFSAYSYVGFGTEALIKEVAGSEPTGVFGDSYRYYSETIVGENKDTPSVLLHTATVTCHVTRTVRPAPETNSNTPSQAVENEDCLISELK